MEPTFSFDDIAELHIEDIIKDSPYIYNGVFVPRVTHVISSMIEAPGIRQWANNLGFKHKSYREELKRFADLGSKVHNALEQIVNNRWSSKEVTVLEDDGYDPISAFLIWWDQILNMNVEVIGTETPLINNLYGGTYDLLIKLNGKTWLVDYKTSNYVTYKYWLQLAAYRKILREQHNIQLDGCMILQLSKYSVSYREWILDLHNPGHQAYFDICERTFLSLLYGYYHITYLEKVFNDVWLQENLPKNQIPRHARSNLITEATD